MPDGTLTTTREVRAAYVDLSATLVVSRDAVSMCLDRAVRRRVLTLGALMVASGAMVVLLAWSFS